jgi:hypothetical protein
MSDNSDLQALREKLRSATPRPGELEERRAAFLRAQHERDEFVRTVVAEQNALARLASQPLLTRLRWAIFGG